MCIDSYADISIHTPTRGTTAGTGTATNLAEFQSTFPREERPYYTIVRIQVLQFQSTLPREERPFPTDFVTAFMPYFNPRSHERSDFTGDYTFEVTLISIHAPTRGATMGDGYQEVQEVISIHAPTRGATIIFQMSLSRTLFQSTLPREERPFSATIEGLFLDFNPRSHERSDCIRKRGYSRICNFNPRSHERSDVRGKTNTEHENNFNPRSHERSDNAGD